MRAKIEREQVATQDLNLGPIAYELVLMLMLDAVSVITVYVDWPLPGQY